MRETFCLGPRIPLSWGARDQGERVGKNSESSYLYSAISSVRGESPHERDSQKLDDVSAVCGDPSLFFTPPSPNVPVEAQRSHSVPDPLLSDQHLLFRRLQWRGIDLPHASVFDCFCQCIQPKATAAWRFWVLKFTETVLGLKYVFVLFYILKKKTFWMLMTMFKW